MSSSCICINKVMSNMIACKARDAKITTILLQKCLLIHSDQYNILHRICTEFAPNLVKLFMSSDLHRKFPTIGHPTGSTSSLFSPRSSSRSITCVVLESLFSYSWVVLESDQLFVFAPKFFYLHRFCTVFAPGIFNV